MAAVGFGALLEILMAVAVGGMLWSAFSALRHRRLQVHRCPHCGGPRSRAYPRCRHCGAEE